LKIKVERTGGIAGLSKYSEMDSKDLPVSLSKTLDKLAQGNMLFAPLKSTPKGAADHYSYKITVDYDANQRVFVCNDYNLEYNLKALIKYVEKYAANR
jgi:hypothetical protein